MNDELFNEPVESIEEAAAHIRGEPVDARVTFVGEPDPRAIRERLGMTRERFADLLCISVKTLHDGEQGGATPADRPCGFCRSSTGIPRSCSTRCNARASYPLPPGRGLR